MTPLKTNNQQKPDFVNVSGVFGKACTVVRQGLSSFRQISSQPKDRRVGNSPKWWVIVRKSLQKKVQTLQL